MGETPDKIKGVAPDDENTPASCGGVPTSADGVAVPDEISPVPGDDVSVLVDAPVPVEDSSAPRDDAPAPGEDTPAPVDDAPAVVDSLSSSKGLLARCSFCLGFSHVGAPSRQQWLLQTRFTVLWRVSQRGVHHAILHPSAPGSDRRPGSAP